MPNTTIKPGQLCVGIFVQLELSWMNHPFMTSSFQIRNEKQLKELKNLGLKKIKFDPARSSAAPLPLEPDHEQIPAPESVVSERDEEMWKEKQSRIKKLKKRTVSLNRCEKSYTKTVSSIRNVMRTIMSQPKAAVKEADTMVSSMVVSLMRDKEATMHLVNMKGKSESAYYHAINVTILALMLGKQLGLDKEQMKHLGVGAMFHDLGHNEIPDRIRNKREPLNKAEQDFVQMHPIYGVRLAERIGTMSPAVMAIIAQHHEMQDGSGYPKGLKGNQISELAQIVAITNAYDNLCNKKDAAKSRTPYEAISTLYAKERHRYNEDMLTLFITNMGVYPPGTIVTLSNGDTAVVISINSGALLSPKVMLYDPNIPNSEALIINLKEEGLDITESVRLSEVPENIRNYFKLGESVNVFFDSEENK